MIAKTTIGRSFKGCCAYNMAKVEQGQGEILMSQGVRDYDRAAMVADFTRQAKQNPDLTRSVWHTSLSFAPQDETRLRANPQLVQQVASDYLKSMKLDQSQYVVIQHRDTAHSHLHIIANRVRFDGHTVSDGQNYARQTQLMRQIEERYGLTPTVEQSQRKSVERLPERDRSRIAMRDQVRDCLKKSANAQELRQALAKHGIRIEVNRAADNVARGLTFSKLSKDDKGEEITTSFKGSKLHKNLSLVNVQRQLRLNAELGQKQAQECEKSQSIVNQPKPEKAPRIEQNHPKRGFGRSM